MDWKEELEEAKELLESGILSEEDFEELKAELLKKRDLRVSYGLDMDSSKEPEEEKVPAELSEPIPEVVKRATTVSNFDMVLIPAGSFQMGILPNGEDYMKWAWRHPVGYLRHSMLGNIR